MKIEISKSDYDDLMSLIDRAVNIIYSRRPPDREYNVARRLRNVRRRIERRNSPINN